MSNYQIIASAFRKLGLDENSLVDVNEMNRALHALANAHGLMQYDTNVAEELWGETPK